MRDMRGYSLLKLFMLCLAVSLIVGAGAPPTTQQKPQPIEKENHPRWKIDPAKGQAVYIPDNMVLETPTVVLTSAALADSSILLSFESDAKMLRLNGRDSIKFDLAAGQAHTLFISLRDAETTLYLDGKESVQNKGLWLAAIASKPDKIPVAFVGANYVTVRFQLGAEAPKAPEAALTKETPRAPEVATVRHESPALPPLTPPNAQGNNVKNWQRAVFQFRSKDVGKTVLGTGTGFIVTRDGFAVTNFHVVKDATNGTALFEGAPKEHPVELWAVEPSYDLALVKVQFDKPEDIPEPLHISDGQAALGSDVYALGFPEFGFTVTKGIVSGVRQVDQLSKNWRKVLQKYATDSKWVQTDCTINHGNSGGPLITANGEVIGITTWCAIRDNNAYFALDISHARKLMSSVPDKPLTFAIAVQKYGEAEAPDTGLPSIAVARTLPAQDLAARIGAMATSIACPDCHGTGTITVARQSGTRRAGGLDYPIMTSNPEVCPKCGGSLYNAVAFAAQSAKVVDTIARLNPDDKDYTKQLDEAGRRLWVTAAKYPNAFQQLNLPAQWARTGKKNPRGTPIMLVGTYIRTLDADEDDPLHVVQCENTLYVLNKTATIHATKGDTVVFGGLLAGGLTRHDGDVMPVLQYGFLVSDDAAIKKTK